MLTWRVRAIKVACREQFPVNHPEFDYPGVDNMVFRGPASAGSARAPPEKTLNQLHRPSRKRRVERKAVVGQGKGSGSRER